MTAPTTDRPQVAPTATTAKAAARRVGSRLRPLMPRPLGRPWWLMAPLGALWAALIGLAIAVVPMLVVWMASAETGLTWIEAIRVAGLMWVVAQGSPIAIAGITYSLLPWGLAVIPVVLLAYAGGWATRRSGLTRVREAALSVLLGSLVYGAVAVGIAAVTGRPDASVGPVQAGWHAALLALLAMGWGVLRAAPFDVARLVPPWLAVVVRAGLVGAFTLLGIGAVAATASLLVHVDDAVTMAQSLHAGGWGGLGLLLLGMAYAPVLAVWGTAYVVGTGVVIGPAVAVSPFIPVTAPTQLPPFPMLAAIPQSASPVSWALPLGGIIAGILVGVLIARRARLLPRLDRLAMAAAAAVVSGALLLVAAAATTGSLGDLRLASVGPSPITVGILTAVLVALGAVPSAVSVAPPAKPTLIVADPDDEPSDSVDSSVPSDQSTSQQGGSDDD